MNPACPACDDDNLGSVLNDSLDTDTDPSLTISLVSHWSPNFSTTFQRPANIPSMIMHCAFHPSPGSSLISMDEVLEAFEKVMAKYKWV